MSGALTRVERARDLPDDWDRLAGCLFQRREFLAHAEEHNPCAQRYWLLAREGRLAACAVVYTLPLDLLTFAGVKSPVRMQLAGVPSSVSAPGVFGEADAVAELVARLREVERGLLIGLNLDAAPEAPGLLVGRTLPTVVLRRGFARFEDYLGSLNSAYRRRLLRARAAFAGVERETGGCERFDERAHALYLEVFGRSRAKLERLGCPFFQRLPQAFRFTRYTKDGALVGWHVGALDGERYFFFLGGLDYGRNDELNTYFNLLLGILEEGIAAGAREIDFGQTAETPKLRLGGELAEKHLFAWHPSPIVRGLLRAGRGLLEYRTRVPEAHVFRTEAAA